MKGIKLSKRSRRLRRYVWICGIKYYLAGIHNYKRKDK